MIVSLWSGPRNLSTALMYFFAHRGDFQVMDEPFFGAFLKKYPVWRPSRSLVLEQMETAPDKVLESLLAKAKHGPLFLKNMANHLGVIPQTAALAWKPIILFREPASVIRSYRKNMEEISLFDLAYQEQCSWMEELRKRNIPFLLVDSDAVQKNPLRELQRICTWLNIPFETRMLSWPAGALPEDGPWAPFWYERVHKSSGLQAKSFNEEIPKAIFQDPLYLDCLPYYQQLKTAYHEQIQLARPAQ